MGLSPASSQGSGGGGGTVTSVTAADTSIVVGGTAAAPTIATATLDVIATDHPPAASVPMNSHKHTGLAAGTAAGDSLRFEQVLAAGAVPIADIADPGAGKVIGSNSGAAAVTPPGFEVGYAQVTATVSVTDTAEATATALISSGALTFDGAAVVCEVFFVAASLPQNASTTNFVFITLFEGATEIGRLSLTQLQDGVSTQVAGGPAGGKLRFTPSAGAHTYKVCAWTNSVTGSPALLAGAGGTAAYAPGFIRFTKV